MKTLVIITMISVVVLADSSRRMPSKQVSVIETNWIVLPPSPVKIRQTDSGVVYSNVWQLHGTNRLLISRDKIGIVNGTSYMTLNVEPKFIIVTQRVERFVEHVGPIIP